MPKLVQSRVAILDKLISNEGQSNIMEQFVIVHFKNTTSYKRYHESFLVSAKLLIPFLFSKLYLKKRNKFQEQDGTELRRFRMWIPLSTVLAFQKYRLSILKHAGTAKEDRGSSIDSDKRVYSFGTYPKRAEHPIWLRPGYIENGHFKCVLVMEKTYTANCSGDFEKKKDEPVEWKTKKCRQESQTIRDRVSLQAVT